MLTNNNIKFEILLMPPENTHSVLVSVDRDAVVFDPWGKASDWEKVLLDRGLKLQAIYTTHGHPDHISAAPELSKVFNINWFLNEADNFLIGWGNELLDMFGIPHIHSGYKQPLNISAGVIEILPGISMEIFESPGHTPGGVTYYFPKYKILLVGDTLFQETCGNYTFPGGNKEQIEQSIKNLYAMDFDDDTYVVHGHGMETTIGWLKKHNPFFKI